MTLTRARSDGSSSTFPVPLTTEVNGSSDLITGIWVLSTIKWSNPNSCDPPPVNKIPCSKISDVSSGGASSWGVHQHWYGAVTREQDLEYLACRSDSVQWSHGNREHPFARGMAKSPAPSRFCAMAPCSFCRLSKLLVWTSLGEIQQMSGLCHAQQFFYRSAMSIPASPD